MPKTRHDKTLKNSHKVESGSLISHHTILILCAFLFGLVMADLVDPVMEHYALAGAAGGLVAYIGLRSAAKSNCKLLNELHEQKARYELENRLTKHMPRRSQLRKVMAELQIRESQHQYLTVAQSSRLHTRV